MTYDIVRTLPHRSSHSTYRKDISVETSAATPARMMVILVSLSPVPPMPDCVIILQTPAEAPSKETQPAPTCKFACCTRGTCRDRNRSRTIAKHTAVESGKGRWQEVYEVPARARWSVHMDSGDGKNDDGDQLGAAQPAVSISAGK